MVTIISYYAHLFIDKINNLISSLFEYKQMLILTLEYIFIYIIYFIIYILET